MRWVICFSFRVNAIIHVMSAGGCLCASNLSFFVELFIPQPKEANEVLELCKVEIQSCSIRGVDQSPGPF